MLPFRLDYVVKISTLRRLGGVRLGLETVGLSIVTLGLVDAVAMLPLAIAAIATSGAIFRAPLVVVLLFCLGCICVLALGPRLVLLPFVQAIRTRGEDLQARRRACRHLTLDLCRERLPVRLLDDARARQHACCSARSASACRPASRSSSSAWRPQRRSCRSPRAGRSSASAQRRACCSHSASTQSAAINFSLASGMLLTVTALAAAVIGVGGSLFLTLRRRHLGHATLV